MAGLTENGTPDAGKRQNKGKADRWFNSDTAQRSDKSNRGFLDLGTMKENKNAERHGLTALRDKYYNDSIEKLMTEKRLPKQMQRLCNHYMAIYKRQPNCNEVTRPLFQRLAFKMAWCDLAEQWFFTNNLSAFSVSNQGEFIGSHLAFQYKMFSETASRDMEKLGLLPSQRRRTFKGKDLAELIKDEIDREGNEVEQ